MTTAPPLPITALRSREEALPHASTIRVVKNSACFVALREKWSELLADSRPDCLFMSWEWLYTWWRHLGSGKRLYIVTVRSGSRLIAIAPMTVRRTGVISVAEFLGTGTVGSDYLDFIIRSGAEAEGVAALASHLSGRRFSMRLSNVREDSTSAVAVTERLAESGWHRDTIRLYNCPFINLSNATWDSYLGSLGSNHRANFRRRLRRLERDFTVRFAAAGTHDERRAMLDQLFRLHLLRWNSRGGSDAFNDPRLLAFHEEMSALALDRGWLRLFTLELDGRTVAAIYGFRYGNVFSFYQSGFDPEFEPYSVGLVLMGLVIRSATEEGASEYDLLHGDETYKYLWAKEARPLVRLETYPPRAAAAMHRHATRIARRAKRMVRR